MVKPLRKQKTPQNRFTRWASLIAILGLLATSAHGATLSGKVVKVVDGDTIHVLDNKNKRHKIRLEGIDAPEKGQPFYRTSKVSLTRLLTLGEYRVRVEYEKRDRYGRILGTVFADTGTVSANQVSGVKLNGQMVRFGYAWAYRKYSNEYIHLEELARKESAGLWAEDSPVPPWEWRKQQRNVN